MRTKYLLFRLSMPNKGSWNNSWSGDGKNYLNIRAVPESKYEEIMKDAKSCPIYKGVFVREKVGESKPQMNYSYDFGDGWCASVSVEEVESKTKANALKKLSDGFCGYDWMIESILKHNEIKSSKQL